MDRMEAGRGGARRRLLPGIPFLMFCCGVGAGTPALAAALSLPGSTGAPPGSPVVVPVLVDDAGGFLGTDLVISYDPAVAIAQAVHVTGLSSSHTLAVSLTAPGAIRIALYGASPLAGGGALLDIDFTSTGPAGSLTPLVFASADVNEGGIPIVVADGSYCVQGTAAPPGPLRMTRLGGSTVAQLAWDAHPYALSYNVYRGAQRDLSDLACWQQGVAGASLADDGLAPSPGGILYYLVTAVTCAGESGAGSDSTGSPRALPAPCP